jgi:hypothetical protein
MVGVTPEGQEYPKNNLINYRRIKWTKFDGES